MANLLSNISGVLEQRLPAGYVLASRPDHPHLFRGPDLVIGGSGKIVAAFVLRRMRSRLHELTARLIATRLAYPRQTAVVAVIPEDEYPADTLIRHFDFHVAGTDGLLKIIEVPRLGPRRAVPAEIKFATYLRYEVLRAYCKIRRERLKIRAEPLSTVRRLGVDQNKTVVTEYITTHPPRHARLRPEVVDTEMGLAAAVDSAATSVLTSFALEGFTRSYQLDDGVPHFNVFTANVLAVGQWPSRRGDPDKPVRASAFSGWLVTPVADAAEMWNLIAAANHALARRLHRARL